MTDGWLNNYLCLDSTKDIKYIICNYRNFILLENDLSEFGLNTGILYK
jgi:hypothetical protein